MNAWILVLFIHAYGGSGLLHYHTVTAIHEFESWELCKKAGEQLKHAPDMDAYFCVRGKQ